MRDLPSLRAIAAVPLLLAALLGRLNRRRASDSLRLLGAVLAMAVACGNAPRPNIVIILTDDAGYSDPGCYGGEMATPNIDALARTGVRFSKFYTNARCSPTRASLMTGMYPHRVGAGELCGHHEDTPFPGYRRNMSREVFTLAEALRQTGYRTLMAGKWHLGGTYERESAYRPLARGFDRHFGNFKGAVDYFKSDDYFLDGAPYEPATGEDEDSFYATRATTEHAVGFIRQARQEDNRPFFLYVAYNAPHRPWHVPEADLRRHSHLYEGGPWEEVRRKRYQGLLREGLIDQRWVHQPMTAKLQRRFEGRRTTIDKMTRIAAMSNVVDEGVGQIVETLRELEQLDNTLIVYLSDNGPDGFHSQVGAAPLTGGKRLLREGGLATHCILYWPAGIRDPGRIERQPGHVIDLMPTFLDLAGSPGLAPSLDGRSLLPVIENRRFTGHHMLFWELYGQQAVIKNARWKYLRDAEGKARLYDLKSDPAETVDLATRRPHKLRRLKAHYQRWADANNVLPPGRLDAWRKARQDGQSDEPPRRRRKDSE